VAIRQELKKEYPSSIEVAIKYFSIISVMNDLKLTKTEINVLAFSSTHGSISSRRKKKEFVSMFGGAVSTLGNIIHRLVKLEMLEKVDGKTRINPVFDIKFQDILLQLHINATG